GAAGNHIVAVVAADGVGAADVVRGGGDALHHAGRERRLRVVAEEDVVAAVAGDRVAGRAADDQVVVVVASDRVDAADVRRGALGEGDRIDRARAPGAPGHMGAVTEDDVIAAVAGNRVGGGAADDDVAVLVAMDGVSATDGFGRLGGAGLDRSASGGSQRTAVAENEISAEIA